MTPAPALDPLLILASTSGSRRRILEDTGFAFSTLSPGVDERAAVETARLEGREITPALEAQLLAQAKAEAAAALPQAAGHLVLGCDSVFEFDGRAYGKPTDDADAARRWRAMRGRTGILHTGHTLVDLRGRPEPSREPGGQSALGEHAPSASATVSTAVTFADISDAEIDAYVATGEPLPCAGAFTVDGRAAAFVERIDGDFHSVVGLSVSALRRLAAQFGVEVVDLWAPSSSSL